MTQISKSFSSYVRPILVSVILTASSLVHAQTAGPSLTDRPIIRPASGVSLSGAAEDFLRRRDGESARVWVFFTDKGALSQADYDRKADSVVLSDRQKNRRSKVGREDVLFVDLPVVAEYTAAVQRFGAQLRRESRWLNAASFVIPIDALSRVSELPYVHSIRPVAVYTRPVEAIEHELTLESQEAIETVNYGSSLAQLTQISVPSVHRRGYNGSGVILAIFDTGYRKSHEAFAIHFAEERVLAEHDFINNDGNTSNTGDDASNQWDHGTNCWSVAAGRTDGRLYGPAYGAQYLLAKTELMNEEIEIEEDNWVAALEWSESYGADVVTSSLGYINDWYTYEDMDGATAVTTVAANTAAGLGIVLCNAIGNEGPALGTLIAPSDAHDMLAVGAVDALGNIAAFSSRGPTYDGRTKPEVCARGVLTYLATTVSDVSYGSGGGTSFATPLVAGVACLLVQAHPTLPPSLIRQSLMETACNADTPDNIYGWGVIDAEAALDWSAGFEADTIIGEAPLTVQFLGHSALTVSSWSWLFGDGTTADVQNPAHTYSEPGRYDITMTAETEYGELASNRPAYIMVLADTLYFESDSAFAGEQIEVSVDLVNSQPLSKINVPFKIVGDLGLRVDSASFGDRTASFESLTWPLWDPTHQRYEIQLVADNSPSGVLLEAGRGEILRIFMTINDLQLGGLSAVLDTLNDTRTLKLTSMDVSYGPQSSSSTVSSRYVGRGDADGSGRLDIEDAIVIIDYVFGSGEKPVTVQAGDVNGDQVIDSDDIIYLIDYMFLGGPPPPTP